MSSTATSLADTAVAATVPYALTALADHITGHHLPTPLDVDVPGRVYGGRFATAWLRPEDTDPWLTTAITIEGTTHVEIAGRIRHQAFGVLHGSCLRVRLLWHTPVVDHQPCVNTDCDRTLCYCPVSVACPRTVFAGCDHLAENVCDQHRSDCTECKADMQPDRGRWL